MSNKAHVSKALASSWTSLVVASVCQLMMVPIALGAMEKVEFALWAFISQLVAALMLAEVGVRSACARLLIDARAKGETAYSKTWVASVCVFTIQGVVMLLLVLALAPFIEGILHLNADQTRLVFPIFLTVGALNALAYTLSIVSTALVAGQQISRTNWVAVVAAIVQLVAFVIAIKLGARLWAFPIGMCAALLVTQPLLISQALKLGLIGRFDLAAFDWGELKTVFRLGIDIFVFALFSVVMGNSLLIFSGYLLSLEETAILAVNLKLVSLMTRMLQKLPGSADPMLMKMVSEGNDGQFRAWWEFITKVTVSLALLSAGIFIVWSPLVVSLWTSDEMVMGFSSIVLLALVPFRYLVHYQFVNSLAVFKEIRKVKVWLFWEIALYTGLAMWLGHLYGMDGLLSANLVSMLGGGLVAGIIWFSRFSEISVRRLLTLLFRLTVPLSVGFCLLIIGFGVAGKNVALAVTVSSLWSVLFVGVGYFVILDADERGKFRLLLDRSRRRIFTKT